MRHIALAILLLILFPLVSSARWIGDLARDYSWREEQARISREVVAAQRAQRIEKRQAAKRTGTRTRAAPMEQAVPAVTAMERRNAMRLLRIERLNASSVVRRTATDAKSSLRLDARRRRELQQILNVLMPAMPDTASSALIPVVRTEICKTVVLDCGALADLDVFLHGSELVSFPVDPEVSSNVLGTGYFVTKTSMGGIVGLTVDAPLGNTGEGISIMWIPGLE